ncbi:hypothetical protein HYPSUDRAFT_199684 [Hypholoma sublateritium FD-334 SS-4]|uniref:Uncharacterized protein n=1 Tax=Hypholoma sublateritium (strain FD-334 SS-4) TaxID=945553 RepID=A0A0D2LDP3_HYPSF|nr:hypothetical protein HYPSUDRAFT_199684 [Hypholoma sublateritium FD-334 SS-4]
MDTVARFRLPFTLARTRPADAPGVARFRAIQSVGPAGLGAVPDTDAVARFCYARPDAPCRRTRRRTLSQMYQKRRECAQKLLHFNLSARRARRSLAVARVPLSIPRSNLPERKRAGLADRMATRASPRPDALPKRAPPPRPPPLDCLASPPLTPPSQID